jgi:hypothetical protein
MMSAFRCAAPGPSHGDSPGRRYCVPASGPWPVTPARRPLRARSWTTSRASACPPLCGKGELVRLLHVVNFRGAEMARIAARNLARRKRPGQVESVPGGGGPWRKACRVLAAASAAFAARNVGRLGHTGHARSLREHSERIPGGGDAASAPSGRGPARPACEARCSSGSRSTLSRAVSRVAPAGRACGALATATRTRAP